MMKARFPLLLLLGTVFLASVSISYGFAYWEQPNPSHEKCVQSCTTEEDPYRHEACEARCKIYRDPEREEPEPESRHEEEEERKHDQPRKHEGEDQPWPEPRRHHKGERTRGKGSESEEDKKEWRGSDRRDDPEDRHMKKKLNKEEDEADDDDEQGSESESQSQQQQRRNPFHLKSNKFQTIFKNQHGHIRLLPRFDRRSNKLENLREYRVLEWRLEPNALLLPHHSDADFLFIVLNGKATLVLVNPDGRDTFNLEEGDAQRIPSGTTFYLLNRDENKNLRIMNLAITFRRPGKLESFFLSSSENQQSYLRGFSKNFLEASFNAPIEEIEQVLLQEEKQQEGVIVKISRDHIRELSKHAISSSRKTLSSEDKSFNLRSRDPIHSNKFGKFFEITPEKNPQLQDLDIFLAYVQMNEGSLMLPHYNSRAEVILMIEEGRGNIELVGLRNNQEKEHQDQEQEDQEEGNRQVERYRANLSDGDVFIIPSSHPVAVEASSDLSFIGIGINAENNQRNFLAGEKENIMGEMHRTVKDLAFPGSGEEVEKLLKNQRQSCFADAQAQQREEDDEGKGRRSPLSSILRAFY